MKLLRYGQPGGERPGLIDDQGQVRDLSGIISDISGEVLSPSSLSRLHGLDTNTLPLVEQPGRLGPCVGRVGKFICIGLNYADHAAETCTPIPDEPVIFMKATSAICGPEDDIIQPKSSTKLDWEVELGVVIGSHTHYVSESEAEKCIAGYCVVHDVSERSFQLEHSGQWVKGKSADTFGPIGPWLVTRDEVPEPLNLSLWLKHNGQLRQNSSTSQMVYGPAFVVHYLSQFMSLQPGDIISTGTPPGVGMGQKPPVYLQPGDSVELGVEGLGVQRQQVVHWDHS